MLFFKRCNHKEIDQNIEHKEVLIQRGKEKLNKRVDVDLKTISKINAKLSNGITLSIHQATTGGRHAR